MTTNLCSYSFLITNLQRKRKLSALVHVACSDFEETIAKFVNGIGKIEETIITGIGQPRPTKRRRNNKQDEEPVLPDEDSDNSDEENCRQDYDHVVYRCSLSFFIFKLIFVSLPILLLFWPFCCTQQRIHQQR